MMTIGQVEPVDGPDRVEARWLTVLAAGELVTEMFLEMTPSAARLAPEDARLEARRSARGGFELVAFVADAELPDNEEFAAVEEQLVAHVDHPVATSMLELAADVQLRFESLGEEFTQAPADVQHAVAYTFDDSLDELRLCAQMTGEVLLPLQRQARRVRDAAASLGVDPDTDTLVASTLQELGAAEADGALDVHQRLGAARDGLEHEMTFLAARLASLSGGHRWSELQAVLNDTGDVVEESRRKREMFMDMPVPGLSRGRARRPF